MDRCPAEIHLAIFTLACTDGGRTGCALSLVSRHIHAASSPARFHTVALHDLPRMRLFLDMLERRSTPPRVSHLFLHEGRLEGWSFPGSGHSEMIASIISTIAPLLVTLSGNIQHISRSYASVIPQGANLSRLRDLNLLPGALRHYSINDDGDIEGEAIDFPNFPSLRRLHTWHGGWWNVSQLNAFTRAAPNLTQIGLDNVGRSGGLDDILDSALDPGARNKKIVFPGGLERLIVRRALPMVNRRGIRCPVVWHREPLQEPSQLSEKHLKVVIGDQCNYTSEDCMEDWLDVIQGGEGCWRIPPRKTISTLREEREIERRKKDIVLNSYTGINTRT
ncbi:hypothetical protein BDY19DRAFT_993924 [Irpex rosettiformis]|uniref:Uncharacterized protein n=1 Tax=Irpex rosettiformis TaxID=378272 RepID=A0ACB8U2I6_9APHY|nr:hypothetical protein BDY19DRAFT_993924 [Irpex rosettiformis]